MKQNGGKQNSFFQLAALKNELGATKLALSEKDNHEAELQTQLQYFRQCRYAFLFARFFCPTSS